MADRCRSCEYLRGELRRAREDLEDALTRLQSRREYHRAYMRKWRQRK